MTTTEVLELVRAGFTKDEITAMTNTETKPKSEPVTTEEVTEAKTEQPNIKENALSLIKDLIATEITKAKQEINTKNTEIEIPKTKTTEETLGEHFKSLIIGGNNG